jgi:tRNA-Thr(GGU) m(6)t(6)A37 methyltransferase TsaA
MSDDLRPGEVAIWAGEPDGATLYTIGTIRTPFSTRAECPRQGREDGPECRIDVDPRWQPALRGLEAYARIEVLYWMDRARRDLVLQSPKSDGRTMGTFALRSPVRPNPIATSIVRLERIEGGVLFVRGLDCLDGTPLLDLKPARDLFRPTDPQSEENTDPKRQGW